MEAADVSFRLLGDLLVHLGQAFRHFELDSFGKSINTRGSFEMVKQRVPVVLGRAFKGVVTETSLIRILKRTEETFYAFFAGKLLTA